MSSPAATDESTPPLIATRTFTALVCQSTRSLRLRAQRVHDARKNPNNGIDVVSGRLGAHRETQRTAGPLSRYAHCGQHVTGVGGAARTARGRRCANTLLVQQEEQFIARQSVKR